MNKLLDTLVANIPRNYEKKPLFGFEKYLFKVIFSYDGENNNQKL